MHQAAVFLYGPKKSGKTTVSNMMLELLDDPVTIAMAGPMKAILSDIMDIDIQHFECQKKKEAFLDEEFYVDFWTAKILREYNARYGIEIPPGVKIPRTEQWATTPRHLMQYIGTDILRSIDPNWHTNVIKNIVQRYDRDVTVFHDIRFANEVSEMVNITTEGCKILAIEMPSRYNNADQHSSEKNYTEIRNYVNNNEDIISITIDNSGTIPDLKKQVKRILSVYKLS